MKAVECRGLNLRWGSSHILGWVKESLKMNLANDDMNVIQHARSLLYLMKVKKKIVCAGLKFKNTGLKITG